MANGLSFKKIIKRDGRVVPFNQEKITNAVFAAARAAGGKDRKKAEQLSNLVIKQLKKDIKKGYPSIEKIQDTVEKILIEQGHARTAKAYISYRQKRSDIRIEKQRVTVLSEPPPVLKITFKTELSTFVSLIFGNESTLRVMLSSKIHFSPFWRILTVRKLLNLLQIRTPWFMPRADMG